MPESRDDLLWEAYRTTRFEVDAPTGVLCIRIGRSHPDLDALVLPLGAANWCYITAWNPGSVPLSPEENKSRHGALRQELAAVGHPLFEGRGRGADPRWEPEESLLVLGVPRESAIALGRKSGQNAVVWGEVGGQAELLDCRG
jgi:hypothetical protein